MDMPTPKKPNGLPALLTTNATTMTVVKTGATTTAIAAVMTKTAAKMITSPSMTTA